MLPNDDHEHINDIPDDIIEARIGRDGLKSLLHLFSGKPDSSYKLYFEPIIITHDDLKEINQCIVDKLKNHDIFAYETQVYIKYTKGEIEQYGLWDEFDAHEWNTPKVVDTVTMKWDFFVKLPRYAKPTRHTITLRISDSLTPLDFMQAVFSNDPDTRDEFDLELATVMCRVDFINHILAQEILLVVDQWYKSRPRIIEDNPFFIFIRKRINAISNIISHSVFLFAVILLLSLINKYISVWFPTDPTLSVSIFTILFTIFAIGLLIAFYFKKFGDFLASITEKAIQRYRQHTVFLITNGDKNHQREVKSKNNRLLFRFFFSTGFTILIDLLSAYISYLLIK